MTLYPKPKTLFLRDNYGHIGKWTCFGETSRSWLCGNKWRPEDFKVSKKENTEVTEDDYMETQWAENHRWRLSELVRISSPEQLRKIAAIIEYQESK